MSKRQPGGGFIARFEGTAVEISKNQVHELTSIADRQRGEKRTLSVEDEIAVRDAIERLGTADSKGAFRSFAEISKRFPKCRPIVHEKLSHRVNRVRKLLVKLLGENGGAANDLEAVKPLLADSQTTVRLAAVVAVRHLGADGMDAIVEFLEQEPVENNRKAGVKTLERWGDPRAVGPLVQLMENETERKVRVFIANALKYLTKKSFGDDPVAWRNYFDRKTQKENLKQIDKAIRR